MSGRVLVPGEGLRYWCLGELLVCMRANAKRQPRTSGKSTQKALIFMPYKNAPKFSLKRPRLSLSNCKCIMLASRSAMLSLSSAKAGSKELRGKSGFAEVLPLGVV